MSTVERDAGARAAVGSAQDVLVRARPPASGALPTLLRRAIATLCLAALVALTAVLVLATAQRASVLSPPTRTSFPAWLAGPLQGFLPRTPSDPTALNRDFSAAVLAMQALYVAALVTVGSLRARWVLAAAVAAQLVLLLAPPMRLTDLFNYLAYARLQVVHGLDPYAVAPRAAPHDPAFPLSTWHRLRSPYGPLFTAGTLPLALLPLPLAYWLLKAAVVSASLGCVALVWRWAPRLGRSRAVATALVGLNPVLLAYGVGGFHNDVFLLLALLGGTALLLGGREAAGGAALVTAVAVKASAGVLAPVLLLGARRRRRALAGAVLTAAVCAALTLTVYGGHLPALGDQSRLVSPFGGPNIAGLILGRGGADAVVRRDAEALLAVVTLAAVAAVLVRRRWSIAAAGWVGIAAAVTLSWSMPWYAMWSLPFAALARSRALRAAVVVLGIAMTLAHSPFATELAARAGVHTSQTAVGRVNRLAVRGLLTASPQRHAPRARAGRGASGRARRAARPRR